MVLHHNTLLPKLREYVKNLDDVKTMSFLVEDEKLLKTYNEIWNKMKKKNEKIKFNIDPVFLNKYLETKIECYNNKITTDFQGKAPRKGIKCVCLSALVITFVFKSGKNYYPQTLLEECKYKIKEKEIKSLIRENLASSSDDKENSE